MSLSVQETLTTMQCGSCGVWFAIPETMRLEKQRDGGHWYCPNGHQRVYSESDSVKFKRLYEQEQRVRASYNERMVAAQRALEKSESNLKKLKKRTAAGVCPCCSRTVSQLAKHMQSKHKEFLALNGLLPHKALVGKIEKTA
jgi:hypothetical protein